MKYQWKLGSTNRTILVFLQDSSATDGSGLTGIVAANMNARLIRVETDNDVTIAAISLSDLTALTDAHSDGGWFEVDATNAPGWYRLDIPDSACAAGAWSAGISIIDGGSNNIAPVTIEIQLIDVDLESGTNAGLSALPTANPGANNGLPTVNASNYVAGIQGTKNRLDNLNDLNSSEVNAACDTALADYDPPTKAELDVLIPNALNVTASGNIGIDWANVENPTSIVDLSATDIQLCDTVTTNSDMRGTDNASTHADPDPNGYIANLDGHTAQTGDNFARLGAPTGASVSADIASVQSDTDDLQVYHKYAQDAVWFDAAAADTGTTLGTHGTADNPVNDLSDAMTLAASLGSRKIMVRGIGALAAADKFHFIGIGYDALIDLNGQNVTSCRFEFLTLRDNPGATVTNNTVEQCEITGGGISPLNLLRGTYRNCRFNPDVGLTMPGGTTRWIDCELHGTNVDISQETTFLCDNLLGSMTIFSVDDAVTLIRVHGKSARVALDTTVTAGNFYFDGNISVTDSSTSTTTLSNESTILREEMDASLVAIGLDHLLAAPVSGFDVANGSIFAELVSASPMSDWDDYDNTSYSLQALRARGDAAWTTAVGFMLATENGSSFTSIPWNSAWDAEVQSEVDDALVVRGLHFLLNTALPTDWTTDIAASSALDYMADDGMGTYDRSTDSQQAIRDRGDSAWISGSSLDAAERNRIADHVWRRQMANIRLSGDGDAIILRSPYGSMCKLINDLDASGGTQIIISHDDGSELGRQNYTVDANADPITVISTV